MDGKLCALSFAIINLHGVSNKLYSLGLYSLCKHTKSTFELQGEKGGEG